MLIRRNQLEINQIQGEEPEHRPRHSGADHWAGSRRQGGEGEILEL